MDEAEPPSTSRHWLVTILAVWAALIIAGLSKVWLERTTGGAIASLLVYVILLTLYAWGTGTGRKSPLGAFLMGGAVYPILSLILMFAVLPAGATGWLDVLALGLRVGFEAQGGPDAHIGVYIPLWFANILGPILLVVLPRDLGPWGRQT